MTPRDLAGHSGIQSPSSMPPTPLSLRYSRTLRGRHRRRAGQPGPSSSRLATAAASSPSPSRVQVAALAERLDALLDELERRGIEAGEPDGTATRDSLALDEPLNEAFRAGTLSLGWDGSADLVLVEARAQGEDEDEDDDEEVADDDPEGPDLLRVRMSAAAARGFVERAGPCPRGRPAVPTLRRAPRPAGPPLSAAQRAPAPTDRDTDRAAAAVMRSGDRDVPEDDIRLPMPALDVVTALDLLGEGAWRSSGG